MNADIQGELFDFYEGREESSGVLVYRNDAAGLKLDVRLDGETVWLSSQQMADLYQTSRRNIAVHIRNILDEGELEEEQVTRIVRQTRQEGRREVMRELSLYNLEIDYFCGLSCEKFDSYALSPVGNGQVDRICPQRVHHG